MRDIRLKKIAEALFIEQGTLYQHLMRIRKQCGGHNAAELLSILYPIDDKPILEHIKLTPRGREVFVLLVEGKTNSDIAQRLGISKSGVRRHLEKMLLQTDCESILELIARYYRSPGQEVSHDD